MSLPIQLRNKQELRIDVGTNLGIVIVGENETTTDSSSIIDTAHLKGGDDSHNGKQVLIYEPACSTGIVAGEIQFVTDYTGSTSDATTGAFTDVITDGAKYEIWDTPWLAADIDRAINQAIQSVTKDCLLEKKTENIWTASNVYEYDCLSDFVGLHMVEYADSVGVEVVLDTCDTAWTAGSANVTVTADTSFEKEGTACAKLVEDGNSAAGAKLGYATISSSDISDCDALEFWIYSSIALTAGYLDFVLSASAAIAATTESLDIPATTAATWTRHIISLANPHSDTAIISLGLINTTDIGACTIYIDNVKAVKTGSRKYKQLNPQYWSIVRNSTNYLKFTSAGKGIVGDNTLLRLSGYQIPALLTDDSTDSTVDPEYIVAQATGMLALGHANSARLQIQDRAKMAQFWLGIAQQRKSEIKFFNHPDSRWF